MSTTSVSCRMLLLLLLDQESHHHLTFTWWTSWRTTNWCPRSSYELIGGFCNLFVFSWLTWFTCRSLSTHHLLLITSPDTLTCHTYFLINLLSSNLQAGSSFRGPSRPHQPHQSSFTHAIMNDILPVSLTLFNYRLYTSSSVRLKHLRIYEGWTVSPDVSTCRSHRLLMLCSAEHHYKLKAPVIFLTTPAQPPEEMNLLCQRKSKRYTWLSK